MKLISIMNKLSAKFDLHLIDERTFAGLTQIQQQLQSLEVGILAYFSKYHSIELQNFKNVLLNSKLSKSQLGQDLIALALTNFKRGGYFVEFGATDGKTLSNTFILEKNFGWKGILVEPGRVWHPKLVQNRNCNLDFRCVWRSSNDEILFSETAISELSTISSFEDCDEHATSRSHSKTYEVATITLQDLLDFHGAPKVIDYLSIDTEGSEYEILRSYSFKNRKINFISCEHNHTSQRGKIYNLLSQKGYKRILHNSSQFDDWYLLENQ